MLNQTVVFDSKQKFAPATSEIHDLAKELIEKYHPNLRSEGIIFVYKRKPKEDEYTSQLDFPEHPFIGVAKIVKEQEKVAFEIPADINYLIILNYNFWRVINEAQMRKHLDFLLAQCRRKETKHGDKYYIRKPDFSIIEEVELRHREVSLLPLK